MRKVWFQSLQTWFSISFLKPLVSLTWWMHSQNDTKTPSWMPRVEQLSPGPQAIGQLEKQCLGFWHAYIQEKTEVKAEVKESHLRHRLYCVTPHCGPEHFIQCQFALSPKAAEFCGWIIYSNRSEELPAKQAVLSNDPKQQLRKVVGTPKAFKW